MRFCERDIRSVLGFRIATASDIQVRIDDGFMPSLLFRGSRMAWLDVIGEAS